jgi:hypothetical protein
MGTKTEKAVRIQLVRILILIFLSALITQHPALPLLCKNVAVFIDDRQECLSPWKIFWS